MQKKISKQDYSTISTVHYHLLWLPHETLAECKFLTHFCKTQNSVSKLVSKVVLLLLLLLLVLLVVVKLTYLSQLTPG